VTGNSLVIRGLRKFAVQGHTRVSELALEFRRLVLQVGHALALRSAVVFEVRSHFLTFTVRHFSGISRFSLLV
jgi:hypothetical protein